MAAGLRGSEAVAAMFAEQKVPAEQDSGGDEREVRGPARESGKEGRGRDGGVEYLMTCWA